jgi:UDP-2,3-diacylglucosamine pyrophosphatase LpxH
MKVTRDSYIYNSDDSALTVPTDTIITTMSDIHIGMYNRPAVAGGAKYAATEAQIDALMVSSLQGSDHVVLAGDIFETIYLPPNLPLNDAIEHYRTRISQWIEQTADRGGTLHILAGNHDTNPELIAMLHSQEAEYPSRLSVHPVALHINEHLFVHGDNVRGKHTINAAKRISNTEVGLGSRIINHVPEILKPAATHLFADVKSHAQPLWQMVADRVSHGAYRRDLYEHLFQSSLLKPIVKDDGSLIPAIEHIHSGHTHLPYMSQSTEKDPTILMHNAGTLADTRHFQPHKIFITEHGSEIRVDKEAQHMVRSTSLRDVQHQGMVRAAQERIKT